MEDDYPKHLYKIENRQLVAYARNGFAITVQQACPLGRDIAPDSCIYLSRTNAEGLRDAINTWLAATPLPTEHGMRMTHPMTDMDDLP